MSDPEESTGTEETQVIEVQAAEPQPEETTRGAIAWMASGLD